MAPEIKKEEGADAAEGAEGSAKTEIDSETVKSETPNQPGDEIENELEDNDKTPTKEESSKPVSEAFTLEIIVYSEESPYNKLLTTIVYLDVPYHKQQETLVVWTEPDGSDLALSFEEKQACEKLWSEICKIHGRDPDCDVTIEVEGDPYANNQNDGEGSRNDRDGSTANDGYSSYHFTDDMGDDENLSDDPESNSYRDDTYRRNDSHDPDGMHDMIGYNFNLPNPDLETLPRVRHIISSICQQNPNQLSSQNINSIKREKLAQALRHKDYMHKLIKVFHEAEKNDDSQALVDMSVIIRSIFSLRIFLRFLV